MNKLYLFAILLSFTTTMLYAQSKLDNNLFLKKLPNGLDILVVEDNSVPLAKLMMTFKGGLITETDSTDGFTALYDNMLMRGNKDYEDQQDFNYHAGQLGLQNDDAATANESASYYFTLPKFNLEAGLNFMNSAVRFAKIDPDELEQEKKTMDEEIKDRQSGQYYAFSDAMLHHLWGDGYSRKKAVNIDIVKSATVSSMLSVRAKYYYPNNALLIVNGDVNHDEVFKLVEKIYGDWKPSIFDPFKKWPIPEFKPLVKPSYFVIESPLANLPLILINWQGPDTRNDISSTYAADVFSYLINQTSSKLYKALVEPGLAYSVSISYLTLKHVGPITLNIRPNPTKIKECMDEVIKQINLMDDDNYLSAEQIGIGKRMLEIKSVRQKEIAMDYSRSLSFWWASASLNYYFGYADNLKKVSKEDIKNYVRKYIKNRPYSAGLLLSPELKSQITSGPFFIPAN